MLLWQEEKEKIRGEKLIRIKSLINKMQCVDFALIMSNKLNVKKKKRHNLENLNTDIKELLLIFRYDNCDDILQKVLNL